jgi:hypothetical protein
MAPSALRKNTGVPPTLLKARTGLCTPPGETCCARSKYCWERSIFASGVMIVIEVGTIRVSGRVKDATRGGTDLVALQIRFPNPSRSERRS